MEVNYHIKFLSLLKFSPDRVSSILAHDVHWIRVVLLAFAHLLTIAAT